MENRKIKIISNGIVENGILQIEANQLVFIGKNILKKKQGEYPFIILKELRKDLEELRIFIMINGSRKDVYPSALSLLGQNAYIQKMGKQSELKDLVNIFDEVYNIELIGTVQDQIDFHNTWISSILSL